MNATAPRISARYWLQSDGSRNLTIVSAGKRDSSSPQRRSCRVVDDERRRCGDADRRAVGVLSREHLEREPPGVRADRFQRLDVPADDAFTDGDIVDGVNGRVRCRGDAADESATGMKCSPVPIFEHAQEQHDRIARQLGELRQQLCNRYALEVGHVEPVGIGAQAAGALRRSSPHRAERLR